MIEQLHPETAHGKQRDGAMIVDVREEHEWRQGHIPGATFMPLSRFMQEYETLPKDTLVILQCAVGGRSQQAAGFLFQQGYQVANLSGGIQRWHQAGLPIES